MKDLTGKITAQVDAVPLLHQESAGEAPGFFVGICFFGIQAMQAHPYGRHVRHCEHPVSAEQNIAPVLRYEGPGSK